jgi:hypothetical protein
VKNPLTVIGGIVCLFLFGIIAVVILGQGLSENARMIVIASIFSAVTAAIPGILALHKSEATQHDLRNGVVKDKVKEALVEVASDTDSDGVYVDTHGLDTGKETNDG